MNLQYLFTTRYDLSPADKIFFNKYKDRPIQSLQIVRTPLDANVGTALNILTLNTWQKAVSESGYDKIFHLFLLIYFTDTSPLILEKNETVRLRPFDFSKDQGPTSGSYTVNYTSNSLTLNQLYQATLDGMGKDIFYTYDAFSNNCQNFVKSILGFNRLLSPQNERFIMQDVQAIVNSLPAYVVPVAGRITKLARKLREIFGKGLTLA